MRGNRPWESSSEAWWTCEVFHWPNRNGRISELPEIIEGAVLGS